MADISIKQDNRDIQVDSPLGEHTLIGTYFEAEEAISSLFTYRLEMVASRTIDPSEILGKDITVRLKRPRGEERVFNGRVVRFAAGPMWTRGYRRYQAELAPWLWFLTRTTDLRIFENKKAPDIIEKIFQDLGFSDFEMRFQEPHRVREYCVQYRETDFNFVSRLLEEEGAYYFFKHERGKHTMVLSDKSSAYQDSIDKEVNFTVRQDEMNSIKRWETGYRYRTGKWAQRDYNFKTPSDKLDGSKTTLLNIPEAQKYEFYDYPGLYTKKSGGGEGTDLTKWLMESEEAGYQVAEGDSDCHGFSPGHKFTLKDHGCADEKGKTHVILTAHHIATDYTHISGEGPPTEYRNSFTCMPITRVYRPPRATPKPVVNGPHTAVVTGPSGEDIHTDEYARIRAKFHWEREGYDSCWMRVAQSWASKKWGTQFIPRIGMEVIVEFLEGDPDRPIVTGCVYNADNMPPYDLPGNKTQSGWKSRSTTGGGSSDFNELRFEDKKGSEEVYFHAEKDFTRVVENNDSLKVGMDKKSPGKQDIEIWGNRTTTIKQGNDDLTLEMGSKSTKVNLGSITYEAMQSITLKCGVSSITLTPASITLDSPMITVDGKAMTMVKAPITMVQGNAVTMVTGGMTTVTGTPCVVTGPPLILG